MQSYCLLGPREPGHAWPPLAGPHPHPCSHPSLSLHLQDSSGPMAIACKPGSMATACKHNCEPQAPALPTQGVWGPRKAGVSGGTLQGRGTFGTRANHAEKTFDAKLGHLATKAKSICNPAGCTPPWCPRQDLRANCFECACDIRSTPVSFAGPHLFSTYICAVGHLHNHDCCPGHPLLLYKGVW